jgi:hypothetical protein
MDDDSGRKKRHTLKRIVTTTPGGLVLDQSLPVRGRRHDMRVFEEHVATGSPGASLWTSVVHLRVTCDADSGFTGTDRLPLPATTRVTPRPSLAALVSGTQFRGGFFSRASRATGQSAVGRGARGVPSHSPRGARRR